jgi:hypothetical protein
MVPGIARTVAPRRALHDQYVSVPAAPQAPEPRSDAGLYPGEPVACRRRVRPFLRNIAHLALLVLVFRVYRIEERAFQGHAFQTLVMLALCALPVHYLAPFRWKKPLFVAVSIAGLFWVGGAWVLALVLALAIAFIGVCHLPIPWTARAAACALMAVACAWARHPSAVFGVPENVWPILASMFMFRLIIYLYEIRHTSAPEPLFDTLGYFFVLPNYCFLHFPVVDYRTMQRGYFADDVHAVQARGLAMMFRGTLHLLCYRLVYNELLVPAADVHDPASLAWHLVCNYLLYLQVSGQFHMACGMLHLFGFQLPATHYHYLLATSFTDYWRRINIYWKDFMVRIFFNPVVFRLKRWPQTAALATATAAVFLATWILHAYQSYWLRGSTSFTAPDALFWGILGALVVVNVQIDARNSKPRRRRPALAACSGQMPALACRVAARSARIAATFVTISLLWSLWSSPSLAAWLDLLHRGLHGS